MDILLWAFVAFAGGAFGAAIGPQTAFVFTCLLYLSGIAAAMGGLIAEPVEGTAAAQGFFDAVVFGPVLGPHIAFAGGAAGTAYAAWKGYHPNGRDIVTPLPAYEKLDVFAVAGVFGVLGYFMNLLFGAFLPKFSNGDATIGSTDTIAMSVIGVAIVARLCFGQHSRAIAGPFAHGVSPFAVEEGKHWVQHQERYGHSLWYGLTFGAIFAFGSAYMVYHFPENSVVTGLAANLGWAVSGVSLFFITFGHKTPVTHHMTLIAGLGAVVMLRIQTGMDFTAITETHMLIAVLVGTLFGGLTGVLGEVLNRLFNARGDTHIDPPAFAIFPMTTVLFAIQAIAM